MEPNPYEAPKEIGNQSPQLDPGQAWIKDRATELAL
jgi:hypothetical protein